MPRQVTFTSCKIVRYQYDAEGTKLKMSVLDGEVRDYIGPFQYLTPGGGSRSRFEISTEEGRYTSASGYAYYHRDHLGNVRAVQGQGGVSQWTDYDPWGLELAGLSSGSNTSRARFNGKEAIAEIGTNFLDFGARGYDATIGRMHQVDGLADAFAEVSPFSFGLNNPVMNIDPSGDSTVPAQASQVTMGSPNAGQRGAQSDAGKVTGGRQENSSTAKGTISNTQVSELQQGLKENLIGIGRFTVELFDTFNGTNFSGINDNPNQGYIGGGAPSLGMGGGNIAKAVGSAKLLNPSINLTGKGLSHTLDRHTVNGIAKWANKSKFFNTSEVESLIRQGTQMPMVKQANGNFSRVVNLGRHIGIDRATGNPTTTYTIITNGQGNLITAFPGIP